MATATENKTYSAQDLSGFLGMLQTVALPKINELISKAKESGLDEQASAQLSKIEQEVTKTSQLNAADFKKDSGLADSIGERMHTLMEGASKLSASKGNGADLSRLTDLIQNLTKQWKGAKA